MTSKQLQRHLQSLEQRGRSLEHLPEPKSGAVDGKSTKKREEKQEQREAEEPDSDVDNLDFNNFKGIYFGDKTEKFQDPVTGCHFEYYDLCKRLSNLKQRRKILDKKLGISTSSQLKSPSQSKAQTDFEGENHSEETN